MKLIYKEYNLEIYKIDSILDPYWLYIDGKFRGAFNMVSDDLASQFVDDLLDFVEYKSTFKVHLLQEQITNSFNPT
jgi:hypothetical protein